MVWQTTRIAPTLTRLAFALALSANAAAAQDKPMIEVVPNIPHSNTVVEAAFSRDGARVLSSGGEDKTVKLWDAATGVLVRTFEGHSERARSVAFSPDGARVLSGSADGTVKLWEATTGALLRTFEVPDDPLSIAFSPDGARVLAGGFKAVRLWDVATGTLVRTFEGHSKWVWSVAFSPNGARVLSGSEDDTINLWDVVTGALLHTFEGREATFSPEGARVLSGGGDKTVRLWDAATGTLLRTFEGHADTLWRVAFAADGARILSSDSKTIRLWDATTGALLRSAEHPNTFAFSSDGARVLSGGDGGTIGLWDATSGALLRTFGGHSGVVSREMHDGAISSVAVSSDGTLSGGDTDRKVRLWDAASGALIRTFEGHSDAVSSVAFSSDSTRVLSGGFDGSVRLWDVDRGTLIRTFKTNSSRVKSFAFSPDGARVLYGRLDGTVELWNTANGARLRTFKGHSEEWVWSVAFSSDGTRVLSGSIDGTVKLWNAATGAMLRTFKGHSAEVSSLAFSPNGTRVLSGSLDGSVRLWDAATGVLLRTFEAGWVCSVAFSADGTRVLSAGDDKTIKLWNAATGALLRTFKGHSDTVSSVAFSPNGQLIVSRSSDTTTRLWDTATGVQVAILSAGRDDRWLTLTSAGFFASSRSANDLLAIVRGLDLTTIDQVHQSLFSPDLVREALAGDPDGEVKRAAEVASLDKVIDSGQAPQVTIISPTPSFISQQELINAQASITDQGGGIGRIEWRVNGVTVGVANTTSGSTKDSTISQDLVLEQGENTVELVAYNSRNLLASRPATATVAWTAPAKQPRPKLFIIAVGINTYTDSLFRQLSQAVADAQAFGSAMKAAGKDIYSEVDVTYALNADATTEKLEKIIDAVGAKMHPRDTFVFFAAAHGKSENGRFHLIPHDYRSPGQFTTEGTIGQDKLQDWFANRIKARRGLILLDTCESGALVGSRASGIDLASSEAALGRLNEATGRPVLTAAAADQAALEGYKGHGVFTYALLDALVNGDTNNNGQIELSELAAHIQTLAPKLSQELRARRGRAATIASAPKSRAAVAMGDAPIITRLQKPRLGSRGEDFAVVKRLSALPAQ